MPDAQAQHAPHSSTLLPHNRCLRSPRRGGRMRASIPSSRLWPSWRSYGTIMRSGNRKEYAIRNDDELRVHILLFEHPLPCAPYALMVIRLILGDAEAYDLGGRPFLFPRPVPRLAHLGHAFYDPYLLHSSSTAANVALTPTPNPIRKPRAPLPFVFTNNSCRSRLSNSQSSL